MGVTPAAKAVMTTSNRGTATVDINRRNQASFMVI